MSRYWDDELYHHGIKGQSWGAQNGPPYPLNAAGKARFRDKLKARTKALKDGAISAKKKLANISTVRKENKAAKKAAKMDEKAERRAEKRNQTLDKLSRSPTALYRNRDAYSTKELKDALDRINTEQKLHEMSIKELNRGKDVLDTIVGYGQTAVKAYSTGTQLKKDFDELFGKKTNSDSSSKNDTSNKSNSTGEESNASKLKGLKLNGENKDRAADFVNRMKNTVQNQKVYNNMSRGDIMGLGPSKPMPSLDERMRKYYKRSR